MWKILTLSTVLIAAQATNIDSLYGEWTIAAFYPVSAYVPVCVRYLIARNPAGEHCSCDNGKKLPSIVIHDIVDDQVSPRGQAARMLVVDTLAEVMPALTVSCRCSKENKTVSHAVVRFVDDNYMVIYSMESSHHYTDKEPNTAYIFVKNVPTGEKLYEVMTRIEDLSERRGAVMCTAENYYTSSKDHKIRW